jgi:hypothetical protein
VLFLCVCFTPLGDVIQKNCVQLSDDLEEAFLIGLRSDPVQLAVIQDLPGGDRLGQVSQRPTRADLVEGF